MRTARRVKRFAAFCLSAFTSLGASAQSSPPSPSSAVTLAPVAVSGSLPGPALWKISKGNHVMWVLGLTSPLPSHAQWESSKIEQLIASSQEVLKPPGMEIGANLGFWGQLALMPSMIGLKKLPDGQTLKQVLPPDLYKRWLVQQNKYLPHSWGVDRLRPTFAGEKLYAAALSQSGLTDNSGVVNAVYSAANHDKVTLTTTAYTLVLDDPRGAAKQFKQTTMNDQQCLSAILDTIDQNFAQTTERANAWATGDLQTLGKILSTKQQDECLTAISSTGFAKSIGMTDLPSRVEQAWVKAARAALDKDTQSVALLPMRHLLVDDGYLKTLEKDGYTVQSPVPAGE
ncbi:TraB/GumN family protein [Dyella mobilis]|uniref:TraB/GumN family protein n=1 Tax=Dyella mobilis TaxID=1849582 RepID=A0ABS2KKT1_9GAMM|nr:TraB/GumN family protein [Dyella mobilis]MBM7131503.1 TraB/GumN family protein [Dyella mobilis]